MAAAKVRTRVTKSHGTNGGILGLQARVKGYPPRASQRLAQAMVRNCREMAPYGWQWGEYTDDHGHDHPGWLKQSIKAERQSVGVWEVKCYALYGIYVEYGTRHMAAQPFFHPGIQRAKREFKDKVATDGLK